MQALVRSVSKFTKTSELLTELFLIFKDNWKHTENFSNFDLKLLSPTILNAFSIY